MYSVKKKEMEKNPSKLLSVHWFLGKAKLLLCSTFKYAFALDLDLELCPSIHLKVMGVRELMYLKHADF